MFDKNNLPPFEDIVIVYFIHTMNNLFPKKCNNKWFIYLIGLLHLIGAGVLSYGILLPNNILPLYLIYFLINILLYYFVFRKKCFMTLLANYYGNIKSKTVHIRINTAYFNILFNILVVILALINPTLSPYNILTSIFHH